MKVDKWETCCCGNGTHILPVMRVMLHQLNYGDSSYQVHVFGYLCMCARSDPGSVSQH